MTLPALSTPPPPPLAVPVSGLVGIALVALALGFVLGTVWATHRHGSASLLLKVFDLESELQRLRDELRDGRQRSDGTVRSSECLPYTRPTASLMRRMPEQRSRRA
jgi:hypothetical protein